MHISTLSRVSGGLSAPRRAAPARFNLDHLGIGPPAPPAMAAKRKFRDGAIGVFASPATALGPPYHVPGLTVTDHRLAVPLDYTGELPGTIDVFFRLVTSRNKAEDASLPYLLYIQGGPGFESPRPTDNSGWLKAASLYFRVVYMDQRGTGLSAGITPASLEALGPPEAGARYLRCFRADSIVRDAEAVRHALLPPGSRADTRWSVLGQSFGGFCAVTYLSLFPDSLAEVLIAGGLPPGITSPCSADDVYRRTFGRVARQNAKFYSRFPAAAERARDVVRALAAQPAVTPAGNLLTPRSFQLLGLHTLGFSHGLERLNFMLETALDAATGRPSQRFMKDFDAIMAWDTNPLYVLLHEAIYCQGGASRWAAHRVRLAEFEPQFDAVAAAMEGRPVLFTGEMVFPWMFDEFKELRRVKAVAEAVAAVDDWPALYDPARLGSNQVAVAAASYFEDMFVDFDLAQETAARVAGLRQHVTSDWLHDGIREAGVVVFDKLLNMARGGVLLR